MAGSPSYDRERAKRYKKWWARQKGSPQGELIQVEPDTWQRKTTKEMSFPMPEQEINIRNLGRHTDGHFIAEVAVKGTSTWIPVDRQWGAQRGSAHLHRKRDVGAAGV